MKFTELLELIQNLRRHPARRWLGWRGLLWSCCLLLLGLLRVVVFLGGNSRPSDHGCASPSLASIASEWHGYAVLGAPVRS